MIWHVYYCLHEILVLQAFCIFHRVSMIGSDDSLIEHDHMTHYISYSETETIAKASIMHYIISIYSSHICEAVTCSSVHVAPTDISFIVFLRKVFYNWVMLIVSKSWRNKTQVYTGNNEETFLHDFFVILKRTLQIY